MGKALYRKYRSKSLDEIVGQSHIVDVLKRSIQQGRIAHAYLLTGPRGVGKTSIARILAHEINKLPYSDDSTHLDIIEIDAASNNGVDDVRDLRDKVQITPVSAEKKIYIIDEVHMLSKPAFNALLKTLEEPPEHVVFILATTDVEKLPSTIISRTQQFGFRLINQPDTVKHLRSIADKEKIKIDDSALELIALRGEGSFRDSISLLDQLASLSDKKSITAELVEQTLGLAPKKIVEGLVDAHSKNDLVKVVELIDTAENLGVQASELAGQLVLHLRRTIATNPELLPLLDELLEVSGSSQPRIKLLTVLAPKKEEQPKPKTAALAVSAPVIEIIEEPIKELEEKALEEKPEDPKPVTKTSTQKIANLDWNTLIEHTRKEYVALYSVLVKCGHQVDENGLTIYTVNGFYKKKLDDPKYRPLLAASLGALGFDDVVIDTVPTASPPKDAQAAKVAAIMGGGEEINL